MKWKYKVIPLSVDAQAGQKQLDALGSLGWELITIDRNEKIRFAYFFAYLKSEAAEPKRRLKL